MIEDQRLEMQEPQINPLDGEGTYEFAERVIVFCQNHRPDMLVGVSLRYENNEEQVVLSLSGNDDLQWISKHIVGVTVQVEEPSGSRPV